jgi:hypothetical protein
MGAHTLLAGTEQVIGKQPFTQGNMGILKDRSHGNGELLTAPGTLPDAFANVLAFFAFLGRLGFEAVGVVDLTALRADRAIGPSDGL